MEKRGRGRPRKIAPDDDNLGQKMAKSADEFFNLYLAEIHSERMRIPPDFIDKFGGNVPEIVTLKTKAGIQFEADVNKINDGWFLEKGWPEFVKENSLEDGDFMTFSYAGNSVFLVKIFAINGCIKGICDVASGNENSEDNRSKGRILSERKCISRNRSFSVVLKKGCIREGRLHIPSEFWRAHLGVGVGERGSSRNATIWMKKKSWDMKIATLSDRVVFSSGWTKFMKDNSLGIGDFCTFRLIDGTDLALKVTVSPSS